MAKTEEGKLEEEVENFLKKKGVWQLARFQAQSNQNGIPDRLYLYKGYLLGLELKASKGEPTKLQKIKINHINENGGIGVIIRNVEKVENLLKVIDCIVEYNRNNVIISAIGGVDDKEKQPRFDV